MNSRKLIAIALLMVTALPLTRTVFAHDRDDRDDRGYDHRAPSRHRDGDRHWDRGYHHDRDWRRDGYRYHRDRNDGDHGYYPRNDWDDRRVTVVLPAPPLLLPPLPFPLLVVPKQH
jgi:hypothetical protein